MIEPTEFQRGMMRAFEIVQNAVDCAEFALKDDDGRLDPTHRAVLALVRSEVRAVVDEVTHEWECDDRVQRAREGM